MEFDSRLSTVRAGAVAVAVAVADLRASQIPLQPRAFEQKVLPRLELT